MTTFLFLRFSLEVPFMFRRRSFHVPLRVLSFPFIPLHVFSVSLNFPAFYSDVHCMCFYAPFIFLCIPLYFLSFLCIVLSFPRSFLWFSLHFRLFSFHVPLMCLWLSFHGPFIFPSFSFGFPCVSFYFPSILLWCSLYVPLIVLCIGVLFLVVRTFGSLWLGVLCAFCASPPAAPQAPLSSWNILLGLLECKMPPCRARRGFYNNLFFGLLLFDI